MHRRSGVVPVLLWIVVAVTQLAAQGVAPGRGTPQTASRQVGDQEAGKAYFAINCGNCHSVTEDLKGVGARYPDLTVLQRFWLSAGSARAGRRGGGAVPAPAPARPVTAAVTFPDGQKVEGVLMRLDDFYVVLRLTDGVQRTIPRDGERPLVEVRDPLAGHRDLLPKYTDRDIHNVTAYLASLK